MNSKSRVLIVISIPGNSAYGDSRVDNMDISLEYFYRESNYVDFGSSYVRNYQFPQERLLFDHHLTDRMCSFEHESSDFLVFDSVSRHFRARITDFSASL